LYPAHRANIHERRAAARVARALPLVLFAANLAACIYGVFRFPPLLLVICAVLNTSLWIYLVSSAVFAILGGRKVWHAMEEYRWQNRPPPEVEPEPDGAEAESRGCGDAKESSTRSSRSEVEGPEGVMHLIVFPNYKEDEAMLEQTLQSIREAEDSRRFRVILAMEEREGRQGVEKAERLASKFKGCFIWLIASFHPQSLTEDHMDGSSDREVAGKASNLKWAVKFGYEACKKEGLIDMDRIVLTVADADCLFHPAYFSCISRDFGSKESDAMSAESGSKQIFTMWQAPQLAFRNFYDCPIPSRSWGYIACVDEGGGVASLAYGCHHMVFSGYSLPFRLAIDAQPWDGDIVAEDHHAYIRCLLYSAHAGVLDMMTRRSDRLGPLLEVRPIFLPVKSTSVASPDGWWQGWIERFHQGKRHAQGVSELSYTLLAVYDLLFTMPLSLQSVSLWIKLLRVVAKLMCMHTLPVIQGVALGILTLYWYANGRHIPQCPTHLYLANSHHDMLLCGLAGAWVLVWPVVVPVFLHIVASYLFMVNAFIVPQEQARLHRKGSVWASQDGGCPPTFGSVRLTVFLVVVLESSLFMAVLAVPFSFIPEVMSVVQTAFWGNRITYITAAKMANYGSTADIREEGDAKQGKKV